MTNSRFLAVAMMTVLMAGSANAATLGSLLGINTGTFVDDIDLDPAVLGGADINVLTGGGAAGGSAAAATSAAAPASKGSTGPKVWPVAVGSNWPPAGGVWPTAGGGSSVKVPAGCSGCCGGSLSPASITLNLTINITINININVDIDITPPPVASATQTIAATF